MMTHGRYGLEQYCQRNVYYAIKLTLDYKMATTKIVNQSILFPTAKNVDIATKIEFLYCFASEILSKQLLDGVHFAIQDGGPKSFPFKWKHWFLISERSQLSKNVFGYNSPQKSSENT